MSHTLQTKKSLDRIVHKFGKDILEVGCGNDNFKEYFEFKGFSWTGLDKENIPGTLQGKMEDLPCGDESFDVVVSVHSFEHCERPIDALKEFYRVIRKGGYLFLSLPRFCKHQLIDLSDSHLFVMPVENHLRLLFYCGFDLVTAWYEKESIEHIGCFDRGGEMRDFDLSRDNLIILVVKK